jgi:hypothetical protein
MSKERITGRSDLRAAIRKIHLADPRILAYKETRTRYSADRSSRYQIDVYDETSSLREYSIHVHFRADNYPDDIIGIYLPIKLLPRSPGYSRKIDIFKNWWRAEHPNSNFEVALSSDSVLNLSYEASSLVCTPPVLKTAVRELMDVTPTVVTRFRKIFGC